jgi:hypothetical protein
MNSGECRDLNLILMLRVVVAFGCTVNMFLISFRPSRRVMKERNPINEQEAIAVETPVTIEILSSAENTYLLELP